MELKVYYNTKCPVCSAGINFQRNKLTRLTQQGIIEWHDINKEPDALEGFGINIEYVRKRLCAVDKSGKLLVGVEAFAAIWSLTPGQQWLGKLVSLPVIHHISFLFYELLALCLYRWNKLKDNW